MFLSPVQSPFQNPYPTEGAVAAEDWWLSGGISASDCVAAYQPKGAASLADSYVNLNNPGTFDASHGVAPAWDAVNAWKFNGSTQFLYTGIIPLPSWTIIFKVANATLTSRVPMGSRGAGFPINTYRIVLNSAGATFFQNGTSGSVAPALTSGVFALAGQKGYIDGADTGLSLGNFTPPTVQLTMGCSNNNGTPANFSNCNFYSAALYNRALTAQENLDVKNAMNLL